jgi:hypothetical protein
VSAPPELGHARAHHLDDRVLDLARGGRERLPQLDHLGRVLVQARADAEVEPRPEVHPPHHECLHRALDAVEAAHQVAGPVGQAAHEPDAVAGAEQARHERLAGEVGDSVRVADDEAGDARRRQTLAQDVHLRRCAS